MSKRCHHCVKGRVQELVVEVPTHSYDLDAYESIRYCPRCHHRLILDHWEVQSANYYYGDDYDNWGDVDEDSYEAKMSRCSAFYDHEDKQWYCGAVGSEECDWECGLLDELMAHNAEPSNDEEPDFDEAYLAGLQRDFPDDYPHDEGN